MLIIKKSIDLDKNIFSNIVDESIQLTNTCLIDIETTGFSSKYHMIYLIGCIYYENNSFQLIQWLCEKDVDEYELLYNFSKFISRYNTIIHYNGSSFDIPFIKARLTLFNIKSSINTINEFDLYTTIKPYNKYLPIENLKLKTLEKFYNITRKDSYDGKALINQYKAYVESNDNSIKEILLLHNVEDLLSLYHCLKILEIVLFFESCRTKQLNIRSSKATINTNNFSIDIPFTSNFTLRIEKNLYDLFINDKTLTLSFPIFSGELKMFFEDYHNYYYLPLEDRAIHKSVGQFVDREYRTKAKKSNCYIKKRGIFIPLNKNISIDANSYVVDYNSTYKYIELTNDLLVNNALRKQLIIQVLSLL